MKRKKSSSANLFICVYFVYVRAMPALLPNTYTESILQKVALLAGGDARVALYILLKSAISAENGRACCISTRHIPADVSAGQQLERTSRIQRLPQHQRLIYKLAKNTDSYLRQS